MSPSPGEATARLFLEKLHARTHFYTHGGDPKLFYRDRKMLTYALTWPAQWLDEKALRMPPERYERLLAKRIEDIATHGDPARWRGYFPAYLLKCVQDWFAWHGEDLYDELKHIRNALWGVDALLERLHPSPTGRKSELTGTPGKAPPNIGPMPRNRQNCQNRRTHHKPPPPQP